MTTFTWKLFRGFTWKPQSSLKTPMKLASGFCIPEPLPVHTGIKEREVHLLIRFLLRRMRIVLISTSLSSLYLFLVGITVQPAESLSAAIPWALQLKEQILKEQITDGRVFFKMTFRPCPSGCRLFLVRV